MLQLTVFFSFIFNMNLAVVISYTSQMTLHQKWCRYTLHIETAQVMPFFFYIVNSMGHCDLVMQRGMTFAAMVLTNVV